MDDAIKTELAVQELVLTVLINDLRSRHPKLIASAAEQLETWTLAGATPEVSAVLQKWADVLAP